MHSIFTLINRPPKPPSPSDYEFVGERSDSERQHIQCSICLEVLYDPILTRCSHEFCRSCLYEHCLQTDSPSCPECRRPCSVESCYPDLRRKDEVESLDVRCKRRSCTFIGERRDLMEHWRFSCPEFPRPEKDQADRNSTRTIIERKKSTIFIKTFDGKNITYRDVDLESTTVDDMKMLIKDRQGIDPKQQRLICLGKQLEDGQLLNAYNIRDSVIVHLVLRQRGG